MYVYMYANYIVWSCLYVNIMRTHAGPGEQRDGQSNQVGGH